MDWIYHKSEDDKCRYTLGVNGDKILMCFGINPSTAVPGDLDNTMRRVEGFVRDNGYDGYLMFNIYPQISIDPDNLDREVNIEYHKENMRILKEVLEDYEIADVWAAWGTPIEKRDYFYSALKDIYDIVDEYDLNWMTFGETTKKGHPRHPLYLKADSNKYEFDMINYLKDK